MRNKLGPYIYWDACVFLDGLRKTPDRIQAIQEIEAHASLPDEGTGLTIVTSMFTIAEVNRAGMGYEQTTKEEVREVERYWAHSYVRIAQLERKTARVAAEIVRQGVVKPPDAIHLATASVQGCVEFHTYDGSGGTGNRLITRKDDIKDVTLSGRVYTMPNIITPEQSKWYSDDSA